MLDSWITYREKSLNKSAEEVASVLEVPTFILSFFEEEKLKRSEAIKVIEKLKNLYSVDDEWFSVYLKTPTSVMPETGMPFSFKFHRNTNSAPQMGQTFGQHIEPHGKYLSYSESDVLILTGYEYGEISFSNPLVIPFESADHPVNGKDSWGWKSYLVATYGCSGKSLSDKLMSLGFDGIITTGTFGPYSIGEVVSLSGIIKLN